MDTAQTVFRGLPADVFAGATLEGDGQRGVDLGFDRYDGAAFARGISVSASIEPRDVTSPQVLANFGGGITLGIGLDGTSGLGCSLNGPDGETAVAWDGIRADE